MINRLSEVLARRQLQPFLDASEAEALISELSTAAVLVDPDNPIDLSADPEDNVVLATAVSGHADLIVSGDRQHLLPLGDIQGIPIVTPAMAIQMLLSKEP